MSNPHRNETLRDDYRNANRHCEILYELGITFTDSGKLRLLCEKMIRERDDFGNPCEVNHVWSNNQRPDYRSNLITLLPATHRWFHSHPVEGRILCIAAKLRKRHRRGEPDEFDAEEMFTASGKKIVGWLQSQVPELAWVEPFRMEAIRRLRV